MKNKNFLYILVALLAVGGWFYWTQIRVSNIRKVCYSEAVRPNEYNFDWAEGKVWDYVGAFASDQNGWIYPEYYDVRGTLSDAYLMAKTGAGIDEQKIITDSMEKYKSNRNDIYKQCLVKEGVSTSL
jgi:hypothetical protein